MNRACLFSRLTALVLAVGMSAGCANAGPQVELKGKRIRVELAIDREDQRRGLMFRDAMPEDHGMLFIFPGEAPRSFWMKNTRIPLDIIYVGEDLRVVSVARNARPCAADPCPGYPSAGPAKYVLELNAGQANALKVRPGDPMTLALALTPEQAALLVPAP
jgi:uncharacterized membrane protein (UPF0127 family)